MSLDFRVTFICRLSLIICHMILFAVMLLPENIVAERIETGHANQATTAC
jgi:hypothetical protein